MTVPFRIPQAMNESCYCSTSSQAFGVDSVPDFLQFDRRNWYFVVSIYIFLMIYDIFSFAYLSSVYIFFGEVSIQTFLPFLIVVLYNIVGFFILTIFKSTV